MNRTIADAVIKLPRAATRLRKGDEASHRRAEIAATPLTKRRGVYAKIYRETEAENAWISHPVMGLF